MRGLRLTKVTHSKEYLKKWGESDSKSGMRNHKAGLVTEVDPEWEQEVAPYDPTAVAMSKPVIRLFQNMPKAYVFLKLHPQQTVLLDLK